jgi:hypothetical protein
MRAIPRTSFQILLQRALVGKKHTLIFSGKSRAKIVFQQRRRTHDQRLLANINQHALQLFQQFWNDIPLLKLC